MTSVSWTKEDITEFDRLIEGQSSPNQLVRIESRLDMKKFISDHGQEKCNAMWEHMENGGELVGSNQ